MTEPAPPMRLIELLGALSLAPDAGNGFAPETTINATVLAASLAGAMGTPPDGVRDVVYGSLLRHLGCTGFAVEEAGYGAGDDIARRPPLLARVAVLAGAAHERLDAGGYHRGARAGDLDQSSRLLAAADVACALAEDRPHRPALDAPAIAATMTVEVAEGRLDRQAVDAVFAGQGGPRPTFSRRSPDGLTDREVEVLRVVATGGTNKDVARRLGITAKTAAHHVAHIYDKTGCRSRAGATLFALDHGLVGPSAPPA